MKVSFHFWWHKQTPAGKRIFKSTEYQTLAEEYRNRINSFYPATFFGKLKPKPDPSIELWICDKSSRARDISSSEQIAESLQDLLNRGTKELKVVIGPPDGFSEEELEHLQPSRKWAFGSLTLPHELASIVALEQVYRACTIIKGHPYHHGH